LHAIQSFFFADSMIQLTYSPFRKKTKGMKVTTR